ncbi:hypothetical protein SeMB42_g07860 [Synchytrium endobioticum]|nr:hypothetical protein SeMB42_g07860 [Synchytrium endobioticum]
MDNDSLDESDQILSADGTDREDDNHDHPATDDTDAWLNMLDGQDVSNSSSGSRPSHAPSATHIPSASASVQTSATLPTATKIIDTKSVKLLKKANDKTGVVYFSRIPPFMTPAKLKSLLAPHGPLARVFLSKEPSAVAARRRKYRHNRRVNYVEGWVEFQDRKLAKRAVDLLNGQRVDHRKRSRYHDDLWTCKYLSKFKWDDLAEQIAYERAVREQKIRVEMTQVKRENKAYIKNVATAKMVEAIQERKSKKRKSRPDEGAETVDGKTNAVVVPNSTKDSPTAATNEDSIATIRRRFKQRKIVDSEALNDGANSTAGVKHVYTAAMEAKKKAVLPRLFSRS